MKTPLSPDWWLDLIGAGRELQSPEGAHTYLHDGLRSQPQRRLLSLQAAAKFSNFIRASSRTALFLGSMWKKKICEVRSSHLRRQRGFTGDRLSSNVFPLCLTRRRGGAERKFRKCGSELKVISCQRAIRQQAGCNELSALTLTLTVCVYIQYLKKKVMFFFFFYF